MKIPISKSQFPNPKSQIRNPNIGAKQNNRDKSEGLKKRGEWGRLMH